MKKVLILLLLTLMVMATPAFAAEEKKGIFSNLMEWNNWLNIVLMGLGLFGATVTGFWVLAKKKIREAGELLIKFADSVEDNKVDANERTDLAESARKLFNKNI